MSKMPTIAPELAEVLASSAVISLREPPAPGVPLHVHMRAQCKVLEDIWKKHCGERLPPGKLLSTAV